MENNIVDRPMESSASAPKKIGKIRGGYLVVVESFRMLGKNRSIMIFPLLSMIFELMLAAAFLAGYFYLYGFEENAFEKVDKTTMYSSLFAFYIIGFFIASFFQAGLVAVVSGQINGRKLSFNEGMSVAAAHTGKIFSWSIVAATVGVVLQMIADKNKTIGRLVANIFGLAWDIITFFIVPVLILENETIGGSLKRSGAIFKNKWGQTLTANFSTALFFGVLVILAIIVFFVPIVIFHPGVWFSILLVVLLAVSIILITILSSTIEGIYRVILYEYAAHDKLPESFIKELVIGAIKTDRQSPQ
jgi:hypothetical protein